MAVKDHHRRFFNRAVVKKLYVYEDRPVECKYQEPVVFLIPASEVYLVESSSSVAPTNALPPDVTMSPDEKALPYGGKKRASSASPWLEQGRFGGGEGSRTPGLRLAKPAL